jgi:hypothetical protein
MIHAVFPHRSTSSASDSNEPSSDNVLSPNELPPRRTSCHTRIASTTSYSETIVNPYSRGARLGPPRHIDAPLRVPYAVQHLPGIRGPFACGPARTVVRHRALVVPVRDHNNVHVQVGHHTGRYGAQPRDAVHPPCRGGEIKPAAPC